MTPVNRQLVRFTIIYVVAGIFHLPYPVAWLKGGVVDMATVCSRYYNSEQVSR